VIVGRRSWGGAVTTLINLSTMKDPALMQKLKRFDNWLNRTRVAPTVSCAFRCNFLGRGPLFSRVMFF